MVYVHIPTVTLNNVSPFLQTFEENSTLEGILGELIIPAVKRKEANLREKGLISLGLCCLIARVRTVFRAHHSFDSFVVHSEWH